MRGMAKLLLNLRHVPDDEADEVRGWLSSDGYDWYETQPSRWGVSAGGLWLRRDQDYPRARSAMNAYQQARAERAREARSQALADGTEPTLLQAVRARPMVMLTNLIAILLLLGLMALVPLTLILRAP